MKYKSKNYKLDCSSLWVGELIKETRAKMNITQRELADTLDVHVQSLSNCERGVAGFPLKRAGDLIDALDISPGLFFEEIMNSKVNFYKKAFNLDNKQAERVVRKIGRSLKAVSKKD